MSKVFFSSARTLRWNYENSVPGKLEALLTKLGLATRFTEDDWVAVKTHWGSPGAFRIIPAMIRRKFVEKQTADTGERGGRSRLSRKKEQH